jgi:proton glutamate symport protein
MEAFGVPKRIVAIVTPMSLTFNMSGSCIHLAMCAFFVAQAAGVAMPLSTTILILLTLKLTSKGVAGIPRANFVILSGLFASFGLPPEGLTLLLGIDAIIDMIRTSVNVMGHCVASPVIARWDGRPVQ